MTMIITLTGHKYCGKEVIADRLSENSGVAFIKPYTDRPLDIGGIPEKYGGFNFVSKEKLDKMIGHATVLCCTRINGHRYVYFKEQLKAAYNVMILDDYALVDVTSRWKGKIYTIRVESSKEVESERIGEYYYKHEFDEVFNYDTDDYDELEARIDSYGR